MEVKQYGVRALIITPTEIYFQCPFKCFDHKIYGKVPLTTRKLPAKVHQVKTLGDDLNDHIVQAFSVPDCPKFPESAQLNICVDILTLRHTPPAEEEAPVVQEAPVVVREEIPDRVFESPRKDDVRTVVLPEASEKDLPSMLRKLAYRLDKEQRTKKDDDAITTLIDMLNVNLKLVIIYFFS